MQNIIGIRISDRRRECGWSQAALAGKALMSERQIQRIEVGRSRPTDANLAAIASAFGVSISEMLTGRSGEELRDFVAANSCQSCGAPLVQRVSVEHEYGDTEYDVFECGSSAGWRDRPCPHSPNFPAMADYDLEFFENGEDGTWSCLALGKTAAARSVNLKLGRGANRSEAKRFVERSYIEEREGPRAAEEFLSRLAHDNPSSSPDEVVGGYRET